jgi:hypothetical protein
MKLVTTRLSLALAITLGSLGPSVCADELKFTDIEKRLGTLDKKNAASRVQTVSFLQETEEPLPPSSPPLEAQQPRELGEPMGGESASKLCPDNCKCNNCQQQMHGVYYTHIELFWMRAHVNEGALGKLSEQYELSPRFILGYEDAGGVGARVRYWTYGHQTPNLASADDAIRFEFDVLDLEATSRFGNDRSELVVGGGMRWADLRIILDGEAVSADMPGISFAADLRTMLCRNCYSEWASIAGVRWSLLGGDWEGSGNDFVSPDRDDNMVVTEIYGGVEYVQHYTGYDVFARLVFEVQNWHSDVAAQTAGASIGFVGPGVHIGMNF